MSTSKPLVSVVIPTYNRAALLDEALSSAGAQVGAGTLFDVEVVVVDDASSDETAAVVRRHPDVRYIRHSTNRGGSAARNTAIAASTGSLIAFLDDDDLWLPRKLALQVPALQAHPEAGGVYSHMQVSDEQGGFLWPDRTHTKSGFMFRALLLDNFMDGHTVLVRREAFGTAGYFDEQLTSSQDYDVLLRLTFHFPFIYVPGVVAVYRPHPDGLLLRASATGRHVQNHHAVVEKALGLLPDTQANRRFKQEARARTELHIAAVLARAGRWDLTRSLLLRSIEMFPDMVRAPRARNDIAWAGSLVALASDSPLREAASLSHEIHAAVPAHGTGVRNRLAVRRALAGLWTEIAVRLGEAPPAHAAAMRAIALDPSKLARPAIRRALLRRGPSRRGARSHPF
jgi:glycosyltransferase involved in cell wall biosynthesis